MSDGEFLVYVEAKPGTLTQVALGTNQLQYSGVIFDLVTLSIVSEVGSAKNSGVKQLDDGYIAVWTTLTFSSASNEKYFDILLSKSGTVIYTGTGTDYLNIRNPMYNEVLSSEYVLPPATGYQPASAATPSLDWLGNSLQHKGKAKPTLDCYKAPAFVGDGVAYGSNANNAGATITSQSVSGTSVTLDSAGRLDIPSGTEVYQVTLSNGSSYSFTEGTPTETAMTVYDRVGNNHITLSNMSTTNWQLLERPDWPL
jgi:hypothetical protein